MIVKKEILFHQALSAVWAIFYVILGGLGMAYYDRAVEKELSAILAQQPLIVLANINIRELGQ